MKKNIIALAFIAIVMVGCTAEQWAGFAGGADKATSISTGVGVVAEKSSIVTGAYGETLSIIALGVASIAGGLAKFAHSKAKRAEEGK
jgi:hypothetical protein